MRKQALFVGNGPNRAIHDSHAWSAIIERLASETAQLSVIAGSSSRPFTLVFEEMLLRRARRGGSEAELKALVAEWMSALEPNEAHQQLMQLDVPHVLTTNYDYALERVSSAAPECVDLHSETRYSLFRCREARARRVWHLHGEIAKPATIMLGHDHYVGYLHKARNYLTTLKAKAPVSRYDYRSPVIHGRYDLEDDPDGYSWIDVFLRDDVHVVGFGFDYSEIAMWWLIGYKERLRMRDGRVPKGVDVGRTIYYYFIEDSQKEPLAGQLQVLRDMGVHIVGVQKGSSYLQGWDNMCVALRGAV